MGHAQISPSELGSPKMEISGGNLNFAIQPSVSGRNYQLQWSDSMAGGTWQNIGALVVGNGNNLVISTPHIPDTPRRFYRLKLDLVPTILDDFVLVPAGSFTMGLTSGDTDSSALPTTVYVSGFYMAMHEVSKGLWDEVAAWAATNGYDINAAGAYGKASNHPAYQVNWYECVKWCNARSEKEGLTPCYTVSSATYKTGSSAPDCNWNASGYRLPSEAEWEKAARGGVSGKRFPWGTDTISHAQANYFAGGTAYGNLSGDVNFIYHPDYAVGGPPYSSPVGSFAPNGYGLYDIAGNMWEWCWDLFKGNYYSNGASDPRGPSSGLGRVKRGGYWGGSAYSCRAANRSYDDPLSSYYGIGFRLARSSVP